MATMYSLLGMLAALTGGMFGGLMQNPWTLATIGVLLAAMSLRMFGLYELRPPAGLLNRLGGATTAGIVGVYLSGLLVGVFAAPCIGPPIVALLTVVGARGDPWLGFGAFFVLSMGLGTPYLVLGTFSGLLQRLPKSGAWMLWVKKVFGVVLLGVGAFYLAMAFWPSLIAWISLTVAAAGGLYLGFIERTGNEKRGFRRVKRALGVVALVYAVWQAFAMPGAGMTWQPYRPNLLEAARADENPVVLDFYADWCIPCHELERKTFTHPKVIAALSGYVRLKVDMTRADHPESREAAERFGVQGVPTIVFLDAQGQEWQDAHVIGFLPPHDFLERIPRTGENSAVIAINEDSTMASQQNRLTNRLIHEKSPYLLQHAHNPVDWHPWGEEAFGKARRENKPIFLSSGYSTCHWCHVMNRESFRNEEIARILNRHFVPIKLDREERPDIDRVYMTYVQATTGGGGWPMGVWLTPDLKPFMGGTYFPPEDKWGRPGFKSVLTRIAEAWESDRERIVASAADVMARLRDSTAAVPDAAVALERELLDRGYRHLKASYDPRYGGFGGAPKFPRPSAPDFMLRYYAQKGTQDALEMTLHTLRAMAEGGMFDQLGGGFHRYSVDERWHVPHFEKMLYDQAQLVCTYLDAYQITKGPLYARIARETLDYVLRDMTGPEGQFYSAEDADSDIPGRPGEHSEGAFYVWDHSELVHLLGADAASIFAYRYGVETRGNVLDDPHNEFGGKNILFVAHDIEAIAQRFAQSPEAIRRILAKAHEKLLAARAARPRPHLDDKTLTAWNGLMLSAFARAHQVLGDAQWLDAANQAATFIRDRLYDETSGTLHRRYRAGETAFDGYLDDYAYLIRGLLDLYEAGFDIRHLEWAMALQKTQDALFWDADHGGYFATTGEDASVLLRIKDDYDGAEPSANSVAAHNLLRLARMTDNPEYEKRDETVMAAFSRQLTRAPNAMPAMLAALDFRLTAPTQIVIAGASDDDDTQALLGAVHARFIPNKVLLLADGGDGQKFLARHLAFVTGLRPVDGKAAAYVCEDGACQLPVSDPEELIFD